MRTRAAHSHIVRSPYYVSQRHLDFGKKSDRMTDKHTSDTNSEEDTAHIVVAERFPADGALPISRSD